MNRLRYLSGANDQEQVRRNALNIIEKQRVNIVIIGPAGAGKNTLIQNLLKDSAYYHVSTGNLLRAEIAKGTAIGNKVANAVKNLQLVDDDTIFELVEIALRSEAATSKQYILFDGFPRNVTQAERLGKALNVSKAISVRCHGHVAIQRLQALGQTEAQIKQGFAEWLKATEPVINF